MVEVPTPGRDRGLEVGQQGAIAPRMLEAAAALLDESTRRRYRLQRLATSGHDAGIDWNSTEVGGPRDA